MKLVKQKLSDIGSIRNGFAFKSTDYVDNGVLLVRQSNISKDIVSTEKSKYLPKSYLDQYKDYQIKYGDYIVGMSGSIGKVSVYKFEEPALQNQRTGLIQSNSESTKKYIAHFLRYMANAQMSLSKGVAVQNISSNQIESFEIPIPESETEQQKIVDKIEELFSEIDNQLMNLDQQLKRLYEVEFSYLRHVFQKKKMLPLTEVSEVISGQHILTENYNEQGDGVGYLTGPADFGDCYPSVSKWTNYPKAMSIKGDVLITVKGAGVGKVNILNIDEVAISRQLMAIRSQKMLPRFIYYQLKAQFMYFQSQGTGSTVPGLNRDQILTKEVAFCSPEEQQKIVAEIDAYLSTISSTKKNVKKLIKKIKLLKQSILKQAFEGKLV